MYLSAGWTNISIFIPERVLVFGLRHVQTLLQQLAVREEPERTWSMDPGATQRAVVHRALPSRLQRPEQRPRPPGEVHAQQQNQPPFGHRVN